MSITRIPVVTEPEPESGEWAPCPTCRKDKHGRARANKAGNIKCKCKCEDRTGYHRREHDFAHRGPHGAKCIWCGIYEEIALVMMGRGRQ
jgi:hypothetical protein